jgi:hypothetical protein
VRVLTLHRWGCRGARQDGIGVPIGCRSQDALARIDTSPIAILAIAACANP